MGIYRTNDPTQYDDIDSIIIDETAPPSSVKGVAANVAIMVAQFERGPSALSLPIGSTGELYEIYGNSNYQGNLELKGKKFGSLKLIRVVASDAAKATVTFDDGGIPTNIIKFDALWFGAYGNNLKVTVEAGSSQGSKYTIEDTNPNAVLPAEIYDNVLITEAASAFGSSKLIAATVLDTSAEPAPAAATNLATGSDGTIADTDYETALTKAEQERAGNVIFLDVYNANRNGYLKAHVALTTDKMCILAGAESDDKAAVITDVANYRDAEGRIIYAWPWVQTTINGVSTFTSPASWVAAVYSQTSPHIALSDVDNTQFLAGITDLKFREGRAGHISLDQAGVLAFEQDLDIGFVIKNAVTTQIANTSKLTILRRRMADFLTNSIAVFAKAYQNKVNSVEKQDEFKGAILEFDARLVRDKILPGAQDVRSGSPLLVDTESLNTDATIAAGKFITLYKRRIFSSMRYIVVKAEIGESVVVTEE